MSYVVPQGDIPFSLTHSSIEWGAYSIPYEAVNAVIIPRDETYRITLWTMGAFGWRGKKVSLSLQCETSQKAKSLIRELLSKTNAQFPLHAISMNEPTYEKKSCKIEGKIKFTFSSPYDCSWFASAFAPYFFPNFLIVPAGPVLTCSLQNSLKGKIDVKLDDAILQLSRRTEHKVQSLLLETRHLDSFSAPPAI